MTAMSKEIQTKIQALNYVGTDSEQFDALMSVLTSGVSKDAAVRILESLSTELYAELIQFEYC